jgi:uncharacterized membrane protein HdeD (DUF308 family)
MNITSYSERFIGSPWWLILLEGIAAIITGILLLIAPGITTLVLVQVLGFYWLFVGVLALVSLFVDRSLWGWKLFSGIIGILAGLVIIRHPLWSALLIPATLILYLAILALVQGVVKLIEAFQGAGLGSAILGILDLVIGGVLLSSPLIAVLFVPFIVGIIALVGGVIALIVAFQVKKGSISSLAGPPPAMPESF